jgi:zinc protease
VHRLETHAAPGDERGLRFDRDVVAFYGDPAWDVRMAAGPLQYRQTLTEADGVFTLEVVPLDGTRSFAPVNTNGSQRGGRPIVQFLPRRLAAVEVVEGGAWKPVVTDTFILVPLPPPDSTDTLRVAVRDRE